MRTEPKWLRVIDALDLMTKSYWDFVEAKREIAGLLGGSVMKWSAPIARRWLCGNSDSVTRIDDEYDKELMESHASRVFRAIREHPDGLGGFGRFGDYEFACTQAYWHQGIFHFGYKSSPDFDYDEDGNAINAPRRWEYVIYGLCVGANDIRQLITLDVMHRYKHVFEFDPERLVYWRPDDKVTAKALAEVKKVSHVATADLRNWMQSLGREKEALGVATIWEMAKRAFPDNHVTRRSIEALVGPRKRGRKEIPR
ncbi:MAG: hypothetical protein KGQ52_14180 [Alphaproteobacteria bacterium]|nr:hypothetical protein [Alphaproteobacteria bacterium]